MNYEEKYKKLYEKARNWYNNPVITQHEKTLIQCLFPEIVFNEDEIMMNQLHDWMKEFGGAEEYTEEVYSWLKGLLEKLKNARPMKPFYIEGRGIYIPIIDKVLAMKDEPYTMTWEDAVKAGAFSKEEAYIIMYYKHEIGRLLKENGGELFADDLYWTSTQRNDRYGWTLSTDDGYLDDDDKPTSLRVRTVSAFEFLKF